MGAIGWDMLLSQRSQAGGKKHILVTGLCFLGLLSVLYFIWPQHAPRRIGDYPQLLTTVVFLLVLVFARGQGRAWFPWLLCLLLMAELSSVSLHHIRQLVDPTPGLRTQRAHLLTLITRGFPAPVNERLPEAPARNYHYYTKQPAISGYMPNIHPRMQALRQSPHFKLLLRQILYPASESGFPESAPASVKLTALTPSRLEAAMTAPAGPQMFVWSSPYTPSWRLSIDGRPEPTAATPQFLTRFTVPKGTHSLIFRYRPPYLWPLLFLSLLCTLTAIGTIFVPYCRSRVLPD